MSTRAVLSLTVMAVFAAGLTACGGGSSSTGGAGGTGGASSSVVVQVSNDNRAAAPQHSPGRENRLAAAISDLLVSKALAQTAGVPVLVLDEGGDVVGQSTTDADGAAVIAVLPGTYTVCILNTNPENCTENVLVGEDQLVIFSDVTIEEGGAGEEDQVLVGNITVESARDHIAEFQDPDNAMKTLVCHKGKLTLSVGTPAALNGHLGHGDTPGPCPDDVDQAAGNNGNNGNNGNPGNSGNNQNT